MPLFEIDMERAVSKIKTFYIEAESGTEALEKLLNDIDGSDWDEPAQLSYIPLAIHEIKEPEHGAH